MSEADVYAQQYQRALMAANEAPKRPAPAAPPPIDTAAVALRQQLIARNPNLSDAEIAKAESRIRGEATRAEVGAMGAALDADWQAERQASAAEADALYGRIVANAAEPETPEAREARHRASIAAENNRG